MDHFGIGQAFAAMARTYSFSAMRSGRTTSLVESVKDGDRIVFSNPEEAHRVHRLCKERGVAVACIVVPPNEVHKLFERSTPQGRTIFDHTWVERFYMAAIERCSQEIDHLQKETSGYGEAHRATRRAAEEMARWR